MGLLRLFLALGVVCMHAYPIFGYKFISASAAVQSFFMISGFYMALILHEKYIKKNGSYRLFIGNRFLRIYPLYWTVLLLLFGFSLIKLIIAPDHDNALTMYYTFASTSPNLFWDIAMTIWRNITLIFTTDYFRNNFHDTGYLLLLPAWTLQMELIFYLIAPFLAKLRPLFLVVLAVPFSVLTFTNLFPIVHLDTSLTFIFISKFIYFIFGMLSYFVYKKIKNAAIFKKYSQSILISLCMVILLYGYFSSMGNVAQYKNFDILYYLFLIAAIPIIFTLSKNNVFDATIGDLSYPVYLSHLLIFKIITNSNILQNTTAIAIVTVFGTLLFSFILVKTIEKPIDALRKKRLHTSAIIT